jgi:hypothetical protein
MKIVKILGLPVLFILFFNFVIMSSSFNNANSQTLENGYYTGKERYNILEDYYYLLTLNDSVAHLELYLVSKGQTSSTSLFKHLIKKPTGESFKIDKKNKVYILLNDSGDYFKIQIKDSITLISKTHNVVLEKVQKIPDNLIEMKNLSLLTFANYYPHLILGYKNRFKSKYETMISAALRQSDLWDKSKQLKYSEYEVLLHDRLNDIVKKNKDMLMDTQED